MNFSEKAITEMTIMSNAVDEILDMLINAISENVPQDMEKVAPLESVIDHLKRHLKKSHIRRVREGKCSVDTGFIFTDYISMLA